MRLGYLKSNVTLEPLIARFWSTPYLLSPCSSGRALRYLFDRLLPSFVRSPHSHVKALQNPGMRGGPFVELSVEKVDQLKELIENLKKPLTSQRHAAESLDQIVQILATAKGEPLHSLDRQPPEVLRGLIETFYTRENSATYKIREPLAYQSSLYDEDLQELLLRPLTEEQRDFVFTTPRLETEGALILPIRHRSAAIDALARARHEPVDVENLCQLLEIAPKDQATFRSFFEPVAPQMTKLPARDLRLTYFGHACVLAESPLANVLIDPLISYDLPHGQRRFTFRDLPARLDAIAITHLHPDHFNIETLLQIRHKTETVLVGRGNGGSAIDPSAKQMLKALGFRKIVEVDDFETVEIKDLTIQALPFAGEHGDLDISSRCLYRVSTANRAALFAADVCFEDQETLGRIRKQCGPLDTLFLGMESEGAPLSWVYGPLLDRPVDRQFDQVRRLKGSDHAQGLQLAKAFGAKQVYIYALGREPWLSHIMSVDATEDSKTERDIRNLKKELQEQGVAVEVLFLKAQIQIAGSQ